MHFWLTQWWKRLSILCVFLLIMTKKNICLFCRSVNKIRFRKAVVWHLFPALRDQIILSSFGPRVTLLGLIMQNSQMFWSQQQINEQFVIGYCLMKTFGLTWKRLLIVFSSFSRAQPAMLCLLDTRWCSRTMNGGDRWKISGRVKPPLNTTASERHIRMKTAYLHWKNCTPIVTMSLVVEYFICGMREKPQRTNFCLRVTTIENQQHLDFGQDKLCGL